MASEVEQDGQEDVICIQDLPISVLASVLLQTLTPQDTESAAILARMQLVSRDFRAAAKEAQTQLVSTKLVSRVNNASRIPDLHSFVQSFFSTLERLVFLESLDLTGTGALFTGDTIIESIIRPPLRRLRSLTADYVTGLTDAGIARLGQHAERFPNLKELSVGGCNEISDLTPLAPFRLEVLRARWCYRLTTVGILSAVKHCRVLDLQGCEDVTDHLMEDLRECEELNLAYTSLTDRGLEALGLLAKKLRVLTLAPALNNNFSSGKFTQNGLQAFTMLSGGEGRVQLRFISC